MNLQWHYSKREAFQGMNSVQDKQQILQDHCQGVEILQSIGQVLKVSYSPLQRNPFFCILPYKMAMFTIEKNHLNIVEKLSFCHHLFVLMWGVSQWVLAAKFSAVSKLFNFENCVILAHIRFNLKLSSLDIFESFDSASGSWLSDLSNDVSIIFQFWLLSELCQIFKC